MGDLGLFWYTRCTSARMRRRSTLSLATSMALFKWSFAAPQFCRSISRFPPSRMCCAIWSDWMLFLRASPSPVFCLGGGGVRESFVYVCVCVGS